MFQFTTATEQQKPNVFDVNQLYNQALQQYVLDYYNYISQQDFILNNQNLNYPNNVVHTDPITTKITNSYPINALKTENISTNEKEAAVESTLLQKNKILLPPSRNRKPIKPKLRSIFLRKTHNIN